MSSPPISIPIPRRRGEERRGEERRGEGTLMRPVTLVSIMTLMSSSAMSPTLSIPLTSPLIINTMPIRPVGGDTHC